METKREKIVKWITVAVTAVMLLVIIVCNVGNDSSDTLETTKGIEASEETNEALNLDASLVKVNEFMVGLSIEDAINNGGLQTSTEKTTEEETEEQNIYVGKFLVNVNEFLNVRASADAESEIVGKIYAGGGGDIIEKGTEWTKVQSGNVVGYIINDYAWFDEEVEAHISDIAACYGTSVVNSLRVRTSGSSDAEVIATIDIGAEFQVLEKGTEWTKISYIGREVYVASNYILYEYEMSAGITTQEEQAAIAAEAERQRLAAEAAEAERQRQQAAYEQAVRESQFVETVQTTGHVISAEDAYLIACTVSAEAGGDIYEDQLAVANVILNRLKAGRYGSTVHDVIYARGQFTVATNGSLSRYISNGPTDVAVQATKDAIAGINNVPEYYNFCSLRAANYAAYSQYTIIGAQVFHK